jgi:hypothetical protein
MSSKIREQQAKGVTKIDLRKEFKQLYSPPAKEVVLVDVPDLAFLMVDGSGNPNTSQEYQDALTVLYNVSYTLKFLIKQEGLSAQVMHIGPYAAEKPTIEKLHIYIKEHGYEFNGKHHEIYLGDPRRAALEKLKTVLRQPVKRVS